MFDRSTIVALAYNGMQVYFDFMNLETRPQKYGKYLIYRKDGKIHWETILFNLKRII